MFRFISFMLGRQWEPCRSCDILKQQLNYYRDENKRLTDTIIGIVSPKAIEQAPIEIAPVQQSSMLFSKRRAALEEKDRQEAFIIAQKKHLAMPDIINPKNAFNPIPKTIEELEKELGVAEEV